MPQVDQQLPAQIHAYLVERYDADHLAAKFGAPVETVEEILGNRKFVDTFLASTVQLYDLTFGLENKLTVRDVLERSGSKAALRLENLLASESEPIQLKASVAILDRLVARKTETSGSLTLPDKLIDAIANGARESDRLTRNKEILGA